MAIVYGGAITQKKLEDFVDSLLTFVMPQKMFGKNISTIKTSKMHMLHQSLIVLSDFQELGPLTLEDVFGRHKTMAQKKPGSPGLCN